MACSGNKACKTGDGKPNARRQATPPPSQAATSKDKGGGKNKNKFKPYWASKKGKNAKKRVRYQARVKLRSECSVLGMHFSKHDTHVLCEERVPTLPLQVLGLGPKFVPSTEPAAALTAHEAALRLTDFGRRVMWRALLHSPNTEEVPRFLVKRPLTEDAPWPARRALLDHTIAAKAVIGGHAGQLYQRVSEMQGLVCIGTIYPFPTVQLWTSLLLSATTLSLDQQTRTWGWLWSTNRGTGISA